MDWNIMVLVGIALLNAFTAVVTYMTKRDMAKLEVNTNNKMDQLLEAKTEAAFGKGQAAERADARGDAKVEVRPTQFVSMAESVLSSAHEGLDTAAKGLKDAAEAVKGEK